MAAKPLIALALFAALAGCAGVPGETAEDKYGRFLVAPGKYVLYSCEELATQAKGTIARMRELENLMAKANSGVVNAIAYRPDYIEKRGELNELRNAAVAKNCKPTPELAQPAAPAASGTAR